MLVEDTDCFGNPLMIWPKHQGGLESFETMFDVVIDSREREAIPHDRVAE
jgi:hypothetical protein